jgi:hypothetical protein
MLNRRSSCTASRPSADRDSLIWEQPLGRIHNDTSYRRSKVADGDLGAALLPAHEHPCMPVKNQPEATSIRRLEDRQEHSVATGFRHGIGDGKQLLAQKFRKPVSPPAAVMELFDIQNGCLLAGGPPLWSCRYAYGNGAG